MYIITYLILNLLSKILFIKYVYLCNNEIQSGSKT